MSYSRRRVSLACTFCRHRKRKCNAVKPTCGNCLESGAECHYDNLPVQRFETSGSTSEILDKLQGIESLLEIHAQNISALSTEIHARPMPPESHPSPLSHHSISNGAVSTPAATSSSRLGGPVSPWFYHNTSYLREEASSPPLTIPAKHNTSSNYLLTLPEMKALVGEYPTNLFFTLESRNFLPPELSFNGRPTLISPPLIDRDVTDYQVSIFFTVVHPCHPILDPDVFSSVYNSFLEKGADNSIESALCLVVIALGATAIGPGSSEVDWSHPPGMQYMQAALPTLMSLSEWTFEWHIFLPQALVLASIYFAYIARPLQSWRLVYSACTIIQFKISSLKTQDDTDPATRESILRLFWSSFLIECDRLAELELPQSNLQALIDETPLPTCVNLPPEISTRYLAELSIRRLLNRIHNTLYPRRPSASAFCPTSLGAPRDFSAHDINSVRNICDELHRQLDTWLSSIPEPFRPSLNLDPTTENDRDRVLRIRYYATKHIIYRPFVLHVIAAQGYEPSDLLLEKCNICLESCRLYLHNTGYILKAPSQYTWTFSLSSLGAILVLTLASLCPSLKHLVLDIKELQTLVIENVRLWAVAGSSLEVVIEIIRDIQRKQRILGLM